MPPIVTHNWFFHGSTPGELWCYRRLEEGEWLVILVSHKNRRVYMPWGSASGWGNAFSIISVGWGSSTPSSTQSGWCRSLALPLRWTHHTNNRLLTSALRALHALRLWCVELFFSKDKSLATSCNELAFCVPLERGVSSIQSLGKFAFKKHPCPL